MPVQRPMCTSCATDTSATRGKFELYNVSNLRESVRRRAGEEQSVTFPDLADRVADDIYSQRLSLTAAAKSLAHWQSRGARAMAR